MSALSTSLGEASSLSAVLRQLASEARRVLIDPNASAEDVCHVANQVDALCDDLNGQSGGELARWLSSVRVRLDAARSRASLSQPFVVPHGA